MGLTEGHGVKVTKGLARKARGLREEQGLGGLGGELLSAPFKITCSGGTADGQPPAAVVPLGSPSIRSRPGCSLTADHGAGTRSRPPSRTRGSSTRNI